MRSVSRTLGIVAAIALGACREKTPSTPDRDGDGFVAAVDCDDANRAVHAWVTAYRDEDGDGIGAGPPSTFCTDGLFPAEWVASGGDCAPTDPAAWRTLDLVDADGDGRTAKGAPLCVGATAPEPYREVAAGNDCDDRNSDLFQWVVAYPDQDGDGIGAPPRSILCVGVALPAGWARAGYDADDRDPSVGRAFTDEDLARIVE